MTYLLRDASDKDIDFLLDLRRETIKSYIDDIWGWDEAFQRKEFVENFCSDLNKIITLDGVDIGVLEINESAYELNITELELLSEFQGKGIGSLILKDQIRKANEMKKTINIGTFKSNIDAIRLYEKLGFRIIDETETHILMSKK